MTRLAVSLGLHRGTMTLTEAIGRFETDGHLRGVAAEAEARRATYDPTYGRYTWGKLEIRRLRSKRWRAGAPGMTIHASMRPCSPSARRRSG